MGGGASKRFLGLPQSQFLYAFGLNGGKAQILKYDCKKRSVTYVNPPSDFEINEHSKAIWVHENCIFICGGVNYEKKQVSKSAFLYNPTENKVVKLPDLAHERFAHFITKVGNDIIVAGGRSIDTSKQQDFLLKSVERINVGDAAKAMIPVKNQPKGAAQVHTSSGNATWSALSDLANPRADGVLLHVGGRLCVIGGLSNGDSRSDVIESIDPTKQGDQWKVESAKFGLCLEASVMLSANRNEVLFFGGQDDFHQNRFWGSLKFNGGLEQGTYSIEGEIPVRLNPKTVYYKGTIHMLGGPRKNCVDNLNITNCKHTEVPYAAAFSLGHDLTTWAHSAHAIEVRAEKDQVPVATGTWDAKNGPRHLQIFGNDQHPAYIEFDRATKKSSKKGVPLSVRQYSYQTAAKVADNVWFFGGASFDGQAEPNFVSEAVYCIDVKSGNGKRHNVDLPRALFQHALAKVNDKQLVITGGQYHAPDFKLQTSADTLIFDPSTGQFNKSGALNVPRHSHTCAVEGNNVYIIGGVDANGKKTDSVEKLDVTTGKWEVTKFKLPKAISNAAAAIVGNELLIIGGETQPNVPTNEVVDIDLKSEKVSTGKLAEGREGAKVWHDRDNSIAVYGGENFKHGGEKVSRATGKDGSVIIKSSKDSEKQALAKSLDNYFHKHSTDIVLVV